MSKIKMCTNKEMAIDILEFIKRNYEKHLNEDSQSGCQKYIEALQMGINALNSNNSWISIIERFPNIDEYSKVYDVDSSYLTRLEIAYQTDTIMYAIGYYDGYKWFNERGHRIENVIAWKPFMKYDNIETSTKNHCNRAEEVYGRQTTTDGKVQWFGVYSGKHKE